MTETTTIRIPSETKKRLECFRDGDRQSLGDIVSWLSRVVPVDTEVTRERDRIAAYLRTHIVRDFGEQDELPPGQALWQELAALQYPGDPETIEPTAVVLDHMALVALGRGHRLLAQLLHAQPDIHQRHVFAPTQALHIATVQQPGLARHVERLGVIEVCDFDLDATLMVGEQIPSNITAAVAHVVHAAQPSKAWPTGRPVLSTVPGMYEPGWRLQLRVVPERV